MLVTNHVLAGAAVGVAFRRKPAVAFGVGVLSHLAMDSLPHFGLPGVPQTSPKFLKIAYRDGSLGLAALMFMALKAKPEHRTAVVAGMLGAAALDVDKPAKHFFGRNPVPQPVQRFHEDIQNEAPHRLPNEVLVGAGLALFASALLDRLAR